MTRAAAGFEKGRTPVTRAVEPRGYDRRFYASALLVGFLFIFLATSLLIYHYAFKTVTVVPGVVFDLSSLFVKGSAGLPEASNPCMVLQDHLEATRTRRYREAYGYLCEGLRKQVTLEGFIASARANSLLFRAASRYSFPSFEVKGTAAGAKGYIEYQVGGRSLVEAAFAKEGALWRIAQMTVIYE